MFEPNTTILAVNLDHHNASSLVKSYILWDGTSYVMTAEDLQYVKDNIQDPWWLEKDRLFTFRVERNSDGSMVYYCEMYKQVYDFKLREEVEKVYRRQVTDDEANYLYQFFRECLSLFKIRSADNFYEQVLSNLAQVTIVATQMKQIRNDLLAESDKYMLPDYPIDDETREKWRVYRQELRDLTNQEAFPDDFMHVVMPLAPDAIVQYNQISELVNVDSQLVAELGEGLIRSNISNILRNLFSATTKMVVLQSIQELGIPLFNEPNSLSIQDMAALSDKTAEIMRNLESYRLGLDDTGIELGVDQNAWQDAYDLLNSKIVALNTRMSELDVGFTFDEVLNKLLEDTRLNLAAEQIVDEL